MTRSLLKLLLPLLVLALAFAAYYSLVSSKAERKKPALSEKVWEIEVITAQNQELAPMVKLYGRIESPERLQAAAPGGGIVDKVFVRNGARVSSGDKLVTLDRRDFVAALQKAQADLRDLDNQIAELQVRHQANLASLETERSLLALADAEVERLARLA